MLRFDAVGEFEKEMVQELTLPLPSLQLLTRALRLLHSLPSPSSLPSFLSAASTRYPLARAFKSPSEIEALDAKLKDGEEGEGEKEVIEA
jgi:hypothetical protein